MRCSRFVMALVVWLIGGLYQIAYSQTPSGTVSGRVTDAATGKPLPFANVYLNASTRGTTTDEQGRYQLSNLPLGTVELVASYVGYETIRRTIRLNNNQPVTVQFDLKSTGQVLSDVTVKARRTDKEWQRQFRRFRQELLGQPFASQCVITNEYAVSFTEENGHLRATASEPLIIENQALGYRLRYDLIHFDTHQGRVYYGGSSRFEELPTTDERQATRYRRNRMRAYDGSLRHLLTSLVAGTYEQEGFLVYQENPNLPILTINGPASLYREINRHLLPLKLNELIQPGQLSFERRLVSSMPLAILYTKDTSPYSPYRDARYAYSQLWLPNRQMDITVDGWVTSPRGMEIQGSLADDRLSTLLPADWQPEKTQPAGAVQGAELAQGQLLPPDARLGRLTERFNEQFRTLAPGAFLHIDKPFYATGDRIWFSAYLFDAATQRLPVGEAALQVDLLTPAGNVVQHQWIRIVDGRAVGNFRLSDSLATGTYRLRAYTDEDDTQHRPAYERSVAVYNLMMSPNVPATMANLPKAPDVQFLPEGGRWVAGLSTRLGIKVVSTDGHGQAVSGRILDSTGREVIRFTTSRLGMGSVSIMPAPGQTYRAEIQSVHSTQRVPLPPVDPDGFSLMADVVSDSSRLSLQIAGTSNHAAEPVYVLIQSRGQLVYSQKVQLQQGLARLVVPAATLPPGLNQITLFSEQAKAQAERLVFIPERLPPIQVKLTTDKSRYQPRERLALNLKLTDDADLPAVAALSASITDVAQIPDDTATADIRAHLLLTGDLRGRVEQPGFYFKATSADTRRALDDLLMTQGWRRVSSPPPIGQEPGGISVVGRVVSAKGQPLPGTQIVVASTRPGQAFVRSAGADEHGQFRVGGMVFSDTISVVAQLTDRQLKPLPAKEARLILERVGKEWPVSGGDTVANWSTLRSQLEAARLRQGADPGTYRDKTARQLKEVTIRARKIEDRPDDIKRRSLHGSADATILFDDNSMRYPNLYEMLRGQVPGVTVSQTQSVSAGAGYSVIIRGIGSFLSSNQPLFLIDGTPVTGEEGTELLSFNPNDIERIEVLKNGGSTGIYGVRGGNGVIAFYTKRWRPGQASASTSSSAQPLTLLGFSSVQREFYLPRYDLPADPPTTTDQESPIDRRDVLYWKPIVQTDRQGRAMLAFPVSDVVRTLRVVIQGVTTDGQPVVSVQQIRVQ
ncbi:hypothetical protein BN8_04396 [Fibrisoma limi BUZ 3]|uniref:Uncharacterized protein n=1 Tax=Fibrisoma limi BUZ 3 TaxID=1185876 RepID=I2GMM9_9BACT|nr:carboxypeptidase regulatory-like domain-containing protein [Fibrisoma limi]CCH55157.1 hypothetical protein BN8_04396 [Fibrisoma limi BUZ 3]